MSKEDLCELIRTIMREELKAVSHEIAKDVAEELTRALRLERNIRNEKERASMSKEDV